MKDAHDDMSRPAAVDQFTEAERAIFVRLLAEVALAAALREEQRDEADEIPPERRAGPAAGMSSCRSR